MTDLFIWGFKMDFETQIQNVKHRCFSGMVSIENKTGKLFHEVYPELESKFWKHAEAKNKTGLLYVLNQITKALDDLER